MQNSYGDYTAHYTLDAHDMPMPEDLGFFRRHAEKRRLTVLARMLSGRKKLRVLDAGCGSGWLSEMLAAQGHDVTAVDLGYDSLKRASVRMKSIGKRVTFLNGDIYCLPLKDGSFDAVIASEIIEHLDRPLDAFAELARVLRPGGIAVVSTPYRETIEQTLCIHCNEKTPVNAHLNSFDKQKLESMFEASGLQVRTFSTFMSRPAERMGISGFSGFLPYSLWRMMDACFCGLLGRQSFLAVRAMKSE